MDGIVYTVAKQGEKIFIGGDFTSVDLRSRNGIAKLNASGALDSSFNPGSGFDKTVYSIALQPDGKPVAGGLFTSFNGTRRLGMARLNREGSLDTSFMDTAYNQFAGLINPLSPDNINSQENFVRSISHYRTNINFIGTNFVGVAGSTNYFTNLVSNDITLDYFYVGGRFRRIGGGTNRNDVLSRSYVARVIGGETAGPGNLSFNRDEYFVDEDAKTAFITITRENGHLGPAAGAAATFGLPSGSHTRIHVKRVMVSRDQAMMSSFRETRSLLVLLLRGHTGQRFQLMISSLVLKMICFRKVMKS